MLKKNKINFPKEISHIGIIMDGNRRWAKSKGLKLYYGHRRGVESAKHIIEEAILLQVKNLTLYAFSSENWKRDPLEIKDLMNLLRLFLKKELKNLIKSGIKLKILGDLSLFEKDIKKQIEQAIEYTKENTKINLIIAINYGSRQEITNTLKFLINQVVNNNIDINDIDERIVGKALYTGDIPDPDLIIRTGGDTRLSNFLLWQSAYSELMFIDKPWPEFTKEDFSSAVNDFLNRERRFGGF
tara:strand:- start:2528 stop:3253 length:726 start_codon:yes stop_codon:yes gene_type:complete